MTEEVSKTHQNCVRGCWDPLGGYLLSGKGIRFHANAFTASLICSSASVEPSRGSPATTAILNVDATGRLSDRHRGSPRGSPVRVVWPTPPYPHSKPVGEWVQRSLRGSRGTTPSTKTRSAPAKEQGWSRAWGFPLVGGCPVLLCHGLRVALSGTPSVSLIIL